MSRSGIKGRPLGLALFQDLSMQSLRNVLKKVSCPVDGNQLMSNFMKERHAHLAIEPAYSLDDIVRL